MKYFINHIEVSKKHFDRSYLNVLVSKQATDLNMTFMRFILAALYKPEQMESVYESMGSYLVSTAFSRQNPIIDSGFEFFISAEIKENAA